MSVTLNACSAVLLLLVSTQTLVFAASEDVEKKISASAETIIDCIDVPWIGGLDWVSHFPESTSAKELQTLIRGIESGETWALEMMEALLEIKKGSSNRDIQNNGAYDQQGMKVNARHTNINDRGCDFAIIFPNNISAIKNQSDHGVNSLLNNSNIRISNDKIQNETVASKVNLEDSDLSSAGVKSENFTILEVFAIVIFLTIGAFMIACTICDIVRRNSCHENMSNSKTMNTLSKFSLYTNALSILSTEVTPRMMPAVHGIRVLSFTAIIIGHRFLMSTLVFAQKTTILDILEGKRSWLFPFTLLGVYAVDTFLLVSGFLTSYQFFQWIQSRTKFNLLTFYLRRYFRITPCLAALMLFAAVLFHHFGNGPIWQAMFTESVNHCPENWWYYFFYVQNFVNGGNTCIPHAWYLALDMQLFFISPIILYPLHRWPKFGIGILSSFLVASVVTPAIILALNGYANTTLRLDFQFSRLAENFDKYYVPTYNRASPYLVGILLGYELASKRRRLTQVNVAINWLVAGALMLLCMWSLTRAHNSTFAYDLNFETASAAVSHLFWSIAMAWILYACTQGYGGLATKFLSLPSFFPISRLSYCIYLLHVGVQALTLGQLRAPPHYLSFEIFYGICGDLVLTISMAFVFSLFVESPFIVLIKILTDRHQSETTTAVQEPQRNDELAIEIK